MVNGTIRLHDGGEIKENVVNDCDLFLGLGIKKVSDDEKGCRVRLQSIRSGGDGLDCETVVECMANFVACVFDHLGKDREQKRAMTCVFLDEFCEEAAGRMGEYVLGNKAQAGSMVLSGGSNAGKAMRFLRGIMGMKEGKQ